MQALANNTNAVNNATRRALEQKHTILLMMDDYHNVHPLRRLTEETIRKVSHMAAIIIKNVKHAPAIPVSSVILIHNTCIDSDLLVNYLCSNHSFGQIGGNLFASYA